MSQPEICVLKTDGTNCDQEMAFAFEVAGAKPDIVHVNEIRSGEKSLADYAGLGLPGGFSYGDDIASGAVLANELTAYLGEELQGLIDDKKPVIGVCNGFQVLTRTGLLPNRTLGEQQATLAHNQTGRFVCKWANLRAQDSVCVFAPQDEFETELLPMQGAHGEGRFTAQPAVLDELQRRKQIVFTYDDNTNGSSLDIAGICDPSGVVLGMMPHPERSAGAFHPDRSLTEAARSVGAVIFNNFVKYAKEL